MTSNNNLISFCRYAHYLGDGDSKGFLRVTEKNPHGVEFIVNKLECVGHIQKRMGSRLRKLKSSLGSKTLSDNKPIGGRGRLTNNAINIIQNYYGLAIRRNAGNLEIIKSSIWTEYYHISSTDANPMHNLCDKEWCKYQKDTEEGI